MRDLEFGYLDSILIIEQAELKLLSRKDYLDGGWDSDEDGAST